MLQYYVINILQIFQDTQTTGHFFATNHMIFLLPFAFSSIIFMLPKFENTNLQLKIWKEGEGTNRARWRESKAPLPRGPLNTLQQTDPFPPPTGGTTTGPTRHVNLPGEEDMRGKIFISKSIMFLP